jgi:hypothetical protein
VGSTTHGIGRIERVMADNARAHRWSLPEVVTTLGPPETTQLHCPCENGKVE